MVEEDMVVVYCLLVGLLMGVFGVMIVCSGLNCEMDGCLAHQGIKATMLGMDHDVASHQSGFVAISELVGQCSVVLLAQSISDSAAFFMTRRLLRLLNVQILFRSFSKRRKHRQC